MSSNEWYGWHTGPTGYTGPPFLGPTGAVTGPAFFGATGVTGPTGSVNVSSKIDYLYNRARINLIGASDAMIKTAMYEAFHEFFKDSSAWIELIKGLTYPGVIIYHLMPKEHPKGVIIRMSGVVDTLGFPIPAGMPVPGVMILQWAPNQIQQATAVVIKNVSVPHNNDLPKIPDWIVETYEPGLLAGVLSIMQAQPNKPYSDKATSVLNYNKFRVAVNEARVAAMRRNTWGTNSWLYPQQFKTNSQRGGVSVGQNYREF